MIELQRKMIGDLDCCCVRSRNSGKTAAVAVFLHGFGAPGTDLVGIGEEMIAIADGRLDDMQFVFPAAPTVIDPDYDGRCWWPINMQALQSAVMSGQISSLADYVPPELEDCRERVTRILEHFRMEFGVAPERMMIGGFSQGGMLAADVLLHQKGRLGGACLWSSMMINQVQWQQLAADMTPAKIVQSHGRMDPVLPYEAGTLLRNFLEQAGNIVDFVSFSGAHQITEGVIRASTQLAIGINGEA